MSSFFEHIKDHHESGLPFVVYRKPKSQEVKALLQNNAELYETEEYSETGFVFAPFDLDNSHAILMPLAHCRALVFSSSSENQANQNEHLFSETIQDTSKEKKQHIALVEKGIEAIKGSDLTKVVLSRFETKALYDFEIASVFQRLLNAYPNAFVYCWYHPKIGLWLGATPESLLKLNGKRLQTVALAGTKPYSETPAHWKPKELEEQNIVTDYIADTLKSSVSNITISDLRTVKAGSLLHLKTTISGTVQPENTNLKELLYALHPTPAVCGFPMKTAKDFIRRNEGYNREFYTGFLGELNMKEKRSRNTNRRNVENNAYTSITTVSDLYVNLRCMQIKENQALVYVGGGITKDSNPEAEWEETQNKAMTMKAVLQTL